ncbi:hypothetical protein JRI60_02330 [Archangium violaceum]|uniref:hypothetical protein n=1 Tax=Archangium violaceum TaxID=83451 RepID=UPI00194F6260|nr:hypothetical protein [Archangium violaceum]QRN97939.1 hypothetical protein JRI60_02330 [Archangium violaceum]
MSSTASTTHGSTPFPSLPEQRRSGRRMSLTRCQRRLLLVWYMGAAPAFLVLIIQTLTSFYEGHGQSPNEVWGWFLPTLMPTLLLVTGVVAKEARKPHSQEQTVERYYFRLAFWLSVSYLFVVNVVLFAMPLLRQLQGSESIIGYLTKSSLFLGPFQGLVGAAMGAVFTSAK